MQLEAGRRLLHYRLDERIGEGGMGEVWKATDTTLQRAAAIKILPAASMSQPAHLARFEHEARLLAALNHPNIAAVFGFHTDQGIHFLAMELVSGEDLAARLRHGPIPPGEALAIVLKVAEALEYSHEHGIVHRDLKPANVKVTPDGEVKVLDFGLAKAVAADAAGGGTSSDPVTMVPTLTSGGTEAGAILGTAPYMSPEQARGRPVDKRTDIWALGCLSFEMLTGTRAFTGETVTDVLAAILTRDPDWDALPATTPLGVRRLLRRCLQKDARLRLRDIGDVRALLEEQDAGATRPTVAGSETRRWRLRAVLPWGVAAVAIALAALSGLTGRGRWSPRDGGPARRIHAAVPLPSSMSLPLQSIGEIGILALSPDGTQIAFVAQTRAVREIYLRSLDRPLIEAVPGTDSASSPFFSPDGRWIGFFAAGRLKKVAVQGGAVIELAEAGIDRGGTWTPDGMIVYAPSTTSGLMIVSASGGEPKELTSLATERKERSHRWPVTLPGGREVAFTVGTLDKPGNYDDSEIAAVNLATGERRTLLRGASIVRLAPGGRLVLGREGQLLLTPLESASGGRPADLEPLLQGVSGIPSSGLVHFDIARDGTVVYVEDDPLANTFELLWASRDGSMERLPLEPREYRNPRVSPDGQRIAVSLGPGRGRAGDVWVIDPGAGALTRITFAGNCVSPIWSPDGERIAFNQTLEGRDVIAWTTARGGEAPVILGTSLRAAPNGLLSFSPDGRFILYQQDSGAGGSLNVYHLDVASGASTPVIEANVHDWAADLSPDGRWLAYTSSPTGSPEVYVQAVFNPSGRWQVSDGGAAPRWSRDGRELFYVKGATLMAVPVRTGQTFSHDPPRPVFEAGAQFLSGQIGNYDVAPDGRFLLVRSLGQEPVGRHLSLLLGALGEAGDAH